MSKNNGGFLLGAIFGAAVAGVTALLYAPKSGEEFRRELNEEFDDLLERASEYKEYAMERGAEYYDVATEKAEDIKVNLKYSADNLKTQLDDASHEATNEWQRVKSELNKSKSRLTNHGKNIVQTTKEEVGAMTEVVKDEVSDLTNKAKRDVENFESEVHKQDSVNYDDADMTSNVYSDEYNDEPMDYDTLVTEAEDKDTF